MTSVEKGEFSILVADDNAASRLLTSSLLKKLGHRVKAVETGLQILKAMTEDQFDLIFMDVQMPEMDGVEATKKIREGEELRKNGAKRIPIVAIGGSDDKDDIVRCMAAGMDNYLCKPIDKSMLSEAIRKHCC